MTGEGELGRTMRHFSEGDVVVTFREEEGKPVGLTVNALAFTGRFGGMGP